MESYFKATLSKVQKAQKHLLRINELEILEDTIFEELTKKENENLDSRSSKSDLISYRNILNDVSVDTTTPKVHLIESFSINQP